MSSRDFDEVLSQGHTLLSEAISKLDRARVKLATAASCPDHGARLAQVAGEKAEVARAALLEAQAVLAPEIAEVEIVGLGY